MYTSCQAEFKSFKPTQMLHLKLIKDIDSIGSLK